MSTRLPPYLITGGRTVPSRDVAIETMVERGDTGNDPSTARFEAARILQRARREISVAELSTHLGLPLGTTMVLVADLLDSGDLVAHETVGQSNVSDREIMTRIIHRVREL